MHRGYRKLHKILLYVKWETEGIKLLCGAGKKLKSSLWEEELVKVLMKKNELNTMHLHTVRNYTSL